MDPRVWPLDAKSDPEVGIDRRVQAHRFGGHVKVEIRHSVSDFGGQPCRGDRQRPQDRQRRGAEASSKRLSVPPGLFDRPNPQWWFPPGIRHSPIKFINIEFEGVCTILMGYLLSGEPAIGDRVVSIFATESPTYTILDLAWLPEGTPESDLPEGFRFSR